MSNERTRLPMRVARSQTGYLGVSPDNRFGLAKHESPTPQG